MEDFRIQVSQVAHDEDEDGLNDADVVGETGDETGEEAPDDADQSAANCDDEEGGKAGQNVRVLDIFHTHADVSVEHVVQHLNGPRQKR